VFELRASGAVILSVMPFLRHASLLYLLLIAFCSASARFWMTKEQAHLLVSEFERLEASRSTNRVGGKDRRSSAPFISGDGFRLHCAPNICDETGCGMDPAKLTNGSCIFLTAEKMPVFLANILPRIPSGVTYALVAHNNDQSCPDQQEDFAHEYKDAKEYERMRVLSFGALKRERETGRLLALHAQNLWWVGYKENPNKRPEFLHCLPIGIENRYNSIGKYVGQIYINAIRRNLIDSLPPPQGGAFHANSSTRMLVAFQSVQYSPDRGKALAALNVLQNTSNTPFFDTLQSKVSHSAWLDLVSKYRFVLTPFGNGLDTHRAMEVMLMGSIPVMRRSSISSCYDDSDNIWMAGNVTVARGSLPVVIVDSWTDLTRDRLEREWKRIEATPKSSWDLSRLFLHHWTSRIDSTVP